MLSEARLRLCQNCLCCYRSGLRWLSHGPQHRKDANYYELLGVGPNASLEEIKNAFFEKSKKLHPDSDPANPALHGRFVELSEAYRVLSKGASRREYDASITRPHARGRAPTRSAHVARDNDRYWEQFHQAHAQEMSEEQRQKRRRRNLHLVGYCVVAMLLSIGAHVVFFKKLEEVHNNFMDEKDRVITEIYKESKERARANGFKKQTEILRQKHQEFLEKYKSRQGGEEK